MKSRRSGEPNDQVTLDEYSVTTEAVKTMLLHVHIKVKMLHSTFQGVGLYLRDRHKSHPSAGQRICEKGGCVTVGVITDDQDNYQACVNLADEPIN